MSILELFEGLSPAQAKELRSRIAPALQQIRAEIVKPKQQGEKDMQISEEVLDQIVNDAAAKLAQAMTAKANANAPDLDAEEKAELAQVRRGDYQTISTIQAKYRHLRREAANPTPAPAAPVDPPEIVQAREAGTLQQVYDQRVEELRRSGRGSQFQLIELKRQFRAFGLEVW